MILRLPHFSDPLAKLERRSLLSPRSDHGLQDVTFVINGTLEVTELALDFQEDLIQAPTSLDEPLPLCEATLTDLSGWNQAVS